MIIYPAIDLHQGRCVRLCQGRAAEETIYSEDPVAMAEHWAGQGAEWLHVVNLDGAFGESSQNLKVLAGILEAVKIPVQFGGGLRDMEAIEEALAMGVRRVVLGTVAVREPEVMAGALARFGSERICVGIDARDGLVATHGWQEMEAMSALELARMMKDLGLTRIIYTDIARDGMLSGVNAEASSELARQTGLRVIASGGLSSLNDIRRLKEMEKDGVEGAIIGRALYTGVISLPEALRIAGGEDVG
ncbi:MAG: 1-(5-phosphoribosyl)-5-[(5-phosphoribosylamino)methylideneamino]imidazole-4-carboxamide isomerase [Anaerolineae bacterium]